MADAVATVGAERIGAAFDAARGQSRAALMPYLMAGYPSIEASLEIAQAYVEAGADLVEVGVPFSDPLADGPVIHAAGTQALAAGATLDTALEICAAIGDRVPAIPMCYSNMVLTTGAVRFAGLLADAGAAGGIVPDMPLGEGRDVRQELAARGLAMVPLVAPTTAPARRRQICEQASGFVYVVSDTGVTGERGELAPQLRELVEAVREEAGVPAAVGFGIGTADQAAIVGRIADGVIIGSRLVRIAGEAAEGQAAEAVTEFLRETRAALAA
ncbi:MAG: tryptophan synthase alpha chain [Solirubrobacterales bacterium]|jgi:tryptophan synthase alpha chain|nr:tryptophan synthase alpha chain [Solirubrobacterales bacterium]